MQQLTKLTSALQREYKPDHGADASGFGPSHTGPIPHAPFGGKFGASTVEFAIPPGSYLPVRIDVRAGNALSWFSEHSDVNGEFGPFYCTLSHSDDINIDPIAYGFLGSSNEPGLRFQDRVPGENNNNRAISEIDPAKPLFALFWNADQKKVHKLALTFQNGNSPR